MAENPLNKEELAKYIKACELARANNKTLTNSFNDCIEKKKSGYEGADIFISVLTGIGIGILVGANIKR